ncbi:MAG: alginate lyase family protein [Kiritimatiellae bacterium]|nr:alginate lyase family protein [Kiritimatiellia bacterium]
MNILFSLAAGALMSSTLSAGTILYLENFHNPGGFTRPAEAVGWKGFWDEGKPGPTFALAEIADSGDALFNSPLGNPAGVNNQPVEGAEVGGVFWAPTRRTNVTIATQEFAGEIDAAGIAAFGWDYSIDTPSGNDGMLMKRALVQVGGQATDTDNWFVSELMVVFDTAALSTGETADPFFQGRWNRVVVPAAGHWIRVPHFDFANAHFTWPRSAAPKTARDFSEFENDTFDPGPLPDGIVLGFGLLMDHRWGGNFWMDNYIIHGETPEADSQPLSTPATGEELQRTGKPPRPGGLHPKAQILAVRQAMADGDPAITEAFQALVDSTQNLFEHIPQPPAIFDESVIGGHQKAFELLGGDAWAAYALALRYQLDLSPERTAYADRAIGILNAWAEHNHGTGGHGDGLVMTYAGVGMMYAAELLRASGRWSQADREKFETWVRTVFLPSCHAIRGRRNNWGDWGTLGAIAAHQFLGETQALEADVIHLRNRIETAILPEGIMPREVSRGRGGLWYTYFSLAPLTAAAEILYNADLYDFFTHEPENGGGLRLALDYLFTYCLAPETWPHYDGDDLINSPSPDSFHGTLFQAMGVIYPDAAYADWVQDAQPVMNTFHHFAWAVPSLMRPLRP